MASWNTNTYTNQAVAGGAGASSNLTIPPAKLVSGKLRFAEVKYQWNGNEAATDTINLCLLKQGARLKPSLSTAYNFSPNNNANATCNIGDTNNALRYANGLTLFGNATANSALLTAFTNCASPQLTTLQSPADVGAGYSSLTSVPLPLGTNDETVIVCKLVAINTVNANAITIFQIAYVDE